MRVYKNYRQSKSGTIRQPKNTKHNRNELRKPYFESIMANESQFKN